MGEWAAELQKGAHVQIEGELRSREYTKDGVQHRIWECIVFRISRLDRRASAAAENGDAAEDYQAEQENCVADEGVPY